MYIIGIRTERIAGGFRDHGEILLLGGRDCFGISVFESLLIRLGGELSGEDIVRLARFHEIERYGRKLRGCAALEEEHRIVVRDLHELAQIRLRLFDDRFIGRRSMAHLHNGHT